MYLKNNGVLLSFLSLILIGFVSCKGGSKPKNDLDKENLKGDVILVDKENEVTFYNSNGMIEKELEDIENNTGYISSLNYINNKLSTEISKWLSPKSEAKTLYYYNEKGILDSSEFNSKDFNSKEYYKFDFNGNIVIDSSISNPSLVFEHIKKYYYHENIIDSAYYFNKMFPSEFEIEKYIDNNPSKLLSYTIDEKGEIKINSTTTYTYIYDAQGNWIEQKSFVDGKKDKVIKRTIIYNGQDISQYEKKYNDFVARLNNSQSDDKAQTNSNDNNSNSTTIISGGGSTNNSNSYSRQKSNNSNNNANQNLQSNKSEKRKCSHCYGSGKCPKCNTPQQIGYYDESGSFIRGNEIRLGYIVCDLCKGAGYSGKGSMRMKCGWCQIGWKYCPECNYGGNGRKIGQCRDCNGTGYRD